MLSVRLRDTLLDMCPVTRQLEDDFCRRKFFHVHIE